MTNANNAVAVIANNVETIESKFYKALGNGSLAASHMRDLIVAVVSSRDTTILAKAVYRAKDKKDDKAAQVLLAVVKEVFPASEGKKIITKDKAGKYSIKIAGIQADAKAVERLESAVDKGLSIRGATFLKEIKGAVTKEETPIDYKAKATRLVKDGADIDLMIAALQALRGVNANNRDTDQGVAH